VENLEAALSANILAKKSASRSRDVLAVLRQRLIEPGTHVLGALCALANHPQAFREACYYEATRADDLLAAFAELALWDAYQAGRVGVSPDDIVVWLRLLSTRQCLPDWSDEVFTRAAQGLLSTTRDFGVLRGSVRKEFAGPSLSAAGFAYVAYRLHEEGTNSRGIGSSRVWHRWMLSSDDVEHLFGEISALGVLRRSQAGSVVRIDWDMPSLLDVANAVA
jgi:hypothetical protein